jgi:AcrR family transcriptional regulator
MAIARVDGVAPVDARTAIISTAEKLFAERGIFTVSLRELNRSANQKSTVALQYHFKDRDGLLRVILNRHGRDIGLQRKVLLDQWLTTPQQFRPLVLALVIPLVNKMHDQDGGPEYLQIAAELLNRSDRILEESDPAFLVIHDEQASIDTWSEHVAQFMPSEGVGAPFHRRFAAIRFVHLELARRAKDFAGHDQSLFTSHLVDLTCALLGSPLSDETNELLKRRREL